MTSEITNFVELQSLLSVYLRSTSLKQSVRSMDRKTEPVPTQPMKPAGYELMISGRVGNNISSNARQNRS